MTARDHQEGRSQPAETTAVVLGASNVTLGFPTIIRHLRQGLKGRTHFYACHGHGRSYGNWSRVLGRSLPGIAAASLWREIEQLPTEPREQRVALLTDIGNDLIYGTHPEQIVEWVRSCLDRLLARKFHTVITQLPLDSLKTAGSLRFRAARAVFFPTRPVNWQLLRSHITELSTALVQLADEYQLPLLEPAADWYSLDPIHIRRRQRPAAWGRFFEAWPSFSGQALHGGNWAEAVSMWRLRPAEWMWLRRERQTRQPAWSDQQLAIHLY